MGSKREALRDGSGIGKGLSIPGFAAPAEIGLPFDLANR
jgi:hypothetical protein